MRSTVGISFLPAQADLATGRWGHAVHGTEIVKLRLCP